MVKIIITGHKTVISYTSLCERIIKYKNIAIAVSILKIITRGSFKDIKKFLDVSTLGSSMMIKITVIMRI
jgi:hypothetical protein